MLRLRFLIIWIFLPATAFSQVLNMETVEANATSIEFMLRDSSGRMVSTHYSLQLLDTASRKLIFYYYAPDAAGCLPSQQVPSGVYDIALHTGGKAWLHDVLVIPNRKNIVTALVPDGRLRFRYEDNRKRQMTEFEARVTRCDTPAVTTMQACSAERPYASGQYFIEVNTTPVARFRTSIDCGSITEVQLPENGSLLIKGTEYPTSLSLYILFGRKYVKFQEMKTGGQEAIQRIQLRPGHYEARWSGRSKGNSAVPHVRRFQVVSNKESRLMLKH